MFDIEISRQKRSPGSYLKAIANYWNFNENLIDQVAGVELKSISEITYVTDKKGNEKSAVFLRSQYFQLPPGIYFHGAFSITVWINQLKFGQNAPRLIDCGTKRLAAENVVVGFQNDKGDPFNVWVMAGKLLCVIRNLNLQQ